MSGDEQEGFFGHAVEDTVFRLLEEAGAAAGDPASVVCAAAVAPLLVMGDLARAAREATPLRGALSALLEEGIPRKELVAAMCWLERHAPWEVYRGTCEACCRPGVGIREAASHLRGVLAAHRERG